MLNANGSLDIEWFRKNITRYTKSSEEAMAFAAELAKTDWCSIEPCYICSKEVGRNALISMINHPNLRNRKLCAECCQDCRTRMPFDCAMCSTWHGQKSFTRGDKDLCNECCIKYRYEIERISNQLQRTIVLGLVSDLTTKQWIDTIGHFGDKCAYCPKSMKVMDHFMPVVLGGGTTVDNCLPSCIRCNSKKNDSHPNELDSLFPSDNLARIREYLVSVAKVAV